MTVQAEYESTKRRRFDVSAALWAGVIAGLAFLVIELVLVALTGMSVFAPLQMMAAILLGPEVLAPAAEFTVGVMLAALFVHFALSIIYTMVLGLIINGRSYGVAIGVGLVFGLALYLLNFFAFTTIYPWFAEARNAISVIAHLSFGATAAAVYVRAESSMRLGRRTEVRA